VVGGLVRIVAGGVSNCFGRMPRVAFVKVPLIYRKPGQIGKIEFAERPQKKSACESQFAGGLFYEVCWRKSGACSTPDILRS
jgi:hypothetical protein